MSEFNTLIKNPDDPKTLKIDEKLAPAMSPAWSRSSRHSKKTAQNEGHESFKDKMKKIFK